MTRAKNSIFNAINTLASAINNLAQSLRSTSNSDVKVLPMKNPTVTSNPANINIKYYEEVKKDSYPTYSTLSVTDRQALYRVYNAMKDPDNSSMNYMKIHWPQMHKALEALKKPSYDPYIWKTKDNKF